jgi:hypothetical protein
VCAVWHAEEASRPGRGHCYLCPKVASLDRRLDDPSVLRPAPLERPKPPVIAATLDLHRRKVGSVAFVNTRRIEVPALPVGELICRSRTV